MIKTIVKWLLTVCFKAVLSEIVIEFQNRKEVEVNAEKIEPSEK